MAAARRRVEHRRGTSESPERAQIVSPATPTRRDAPERSASPKQLRGVEISVTNPEKKTARAPKQPQDADMPEPLDCSPIVCAVLGTPQTEALRLNIVIVFKRLYCQICLPHCQTI